MKGQGSAAFKTFTRVETDQQGCTLELQALCSKLSRLSPGKFRVVKEINDKLLKAFATE